MTKDADNLRVGNQFFNPSGSLSGSKISWGDFPHAAISVWAHEMRPVPMETPFEMGVEKARLFGQSWQDSALFENLV